MFRVAVSASLVCVLLLSTLVLTRDAQACPVVIPETLLSLYKKSPEIHLARFDRSVEEGVEDDGESWQRVSVRRQYDVVSTLKGEHRKSFAFADSDYRQKPNAADVVDEEDVEEKSVDHPADEDADEAVEESSIHEVKPGDIVLLFLSPEEELETDEDEPKVVSPTAKKAEKKVTLVPTDGGFGVRKIDERDAGSYVSQIKSLNSIFASASDKRPAMLAEWLINGIEDPVTRWDAAFELSQSLGDLTVYESRTAEREKDKEEGSNRFSLDDPDEERVAVAKQISEAQKQRVISVFTSPLPDHQTDLTQAQLKRADFVMMELVKDWGGQNVATLLLERLKRGVADRYDTAVLMSSIAEVLDADPELTAVTEEFDNVLHGDDQEKFVKKRLSEDDPEPPSVARTYLEERNDIIARFLTAAEARIAAGKSAPSEVAKNESEKVNK